ncbi:MAG: hypothetical protein GY856_10480 [bacterium]|nr:hypothetical protein [bacterium]
MPDTFPFYAPGERRAAGIETIKLFATIEDTDLRPLFQENYREIPNWQAGIESSALGRVLGALVESPDPATGLQSMDCCFRE